MTSSLVNLQDLIKNPEQYYIAISKTSLNKETPEVVIVKKDFFSFLAKNLYSRTLIYDKKRIEELLTPMANKNSNPQIPQILKVLNRKVSQTFKDFVKHPDQYSIKVREPVGKEEPSIVLVKNNSFRTIFEKYIWSGNFTYDPKKVKNAMALVLSKHPDKRLEVVNKLFQKGAIPAKQNQEDIAETMLRLESESRSNKKPLAEVDICQAFDIRDDSISMGKWKGICTIGEYNEYVLMADEEDSSASRIHTQVDVIKAVLTTNPRGFLFLKKDTQTLQAFRLHDKQVEMYDKELGFWVTCRDEDLRELDLKKEDLCISLGADFVDSVKDKLYPEETRASFSGPTGYFYQELQGDDSFCAVYAINHFLGYHALDESSFYVFARQKMIQKLGLQPEGLYAKGASVADVRRGADPSLVADYLSEGSQKYVVETAKRAGKWEIDKLSIPPECDRMVVGYGGAHFAVLRKDSKQNKWFLIDSLDRSSQNKAYDTLTDALMLPDRAGAATGNISIVYRS